MKESVIYQDILREGLAKGLAECKAKGLAEATKSNMSTDLIAQATGLTLKQIEKLQKLAAKQSQSLKSSPTKRSSKS